MITNEIPYRVGDIIKWGFDSCYKCHVEEYGMHVWCGHSCVEWYTKDCRVLEVKWGDVEVRYKEYEPGWSYLISIEKWNNEVYEEWVPHWRIKKDG